jgi:hypothetical protein
VIDMALAIWDGHGAEQRDADAALKYSLPSMLAIGYVFASFLSGAKLASCSR